MAAPGLYAISDLHVSYAENRQVTAGIRPAHDGDWLIVAGDVGEKFDDVVRTLELLAGRFAKVIWSPGNHELWTMRDDPVRARGVDRYRLLVEACRRIGVLTPEDEYQVWSGAGGPVVVAPLFLLYDYTFRMPGLDTKEASLARAYEVGVVCTDEFLLHPDPYDSREAWCRARVEETATRLDAAAVHRAPSGRCWSESCGRCPSGSGRTGVTG